MQLTDRDRLLIGFHTDFMDRLGHDPDWKREEPSDYGVDVTAFKQCLRG